MTFLLKACAIAFEQECVFPSKAIEMFRGGLDLSCLACAEEISSIRHWWRGQRTQRGSSICLALPGETSAGCPGPAA